MTVDVSAAAATIREAIGYAEEGRASHVHWAEHLEAHADGSCERCTPEIIETAGDAEVQREWVRKYDVILDGLRFALDPALTKNLLDAIARISDEVEHEYRVKNARRALRYRALLAETERDRVTGPAAATIRGFVESITCADPECETCRASRADALAEVDGLAARLAEAERERDEAHRRIGESEALLGELGAGGTPAGRSAEMGVRFLEGTYDGPARRAVLHPQRPARPRLRSLQAPQQGLAGAIHNLAARAERAEQQLAALGEAAEWFVAEMQDRFGPFESKSADALTAALAAEETGQ